MSEVKTFTDLSTELAAGGTVTLSSDYYVRTGNDKTIDAPASVVVVKGEGAVIDAAKNGRIFYNSNSAADLTLQNVTLKNGYYSGNGGIAEFTNGKLTIVDSVVSDTFATGAGGAFRGSGAAILSMTNTLFTNTTNNGNGAVFSAACESEFVGNTFTYNPVGSGNGVVFLEGSKNSTLTGNYFAHNGYRSVSSVMTGTVTLTDNIFEDNTAGVALYNNVGSTAAILTVEGGYFKGNKGAYETHTSSKGNVTFKDVQFLTASDTINNAGADVITLEGTVSFAGNVKSTTAITATGATVVLDLRTYEAGNTKEIITSLDNIIDGDFEVLVSSAQNASTYTLAKSASQESYTFTLRVDGSTSVEEELESDYGDVTVGFHTYALITDSTTPSTLKLYVTTIESEGNFSDLKTELAGAEETILTNSAYNYDAETDASTWKTGVTLADGKNIIGGGSMLDAAGKTGFFTVGGTASMHNVNLLNGAGASGAALNVASEGETHVYSSNFSGNVATANGGAVAVDGDLTVDGGSLTGNSAVNGGAIAVGTKGKLTMQDTSISKNTATSGAGLDVAGSAVLNNVTIRENVATADGGGARVADKATLTMNGGALTGNTAKNGGGASVIGTADFSKTAITNNVATENGGALMIAGTVILTDTALASNSAKNGGGAYIDKEVTLDSLQVKDNTATENGGGLFANKKATLNAGNIVGNTAKNGGGAYAAAALNLADGDFTNNVASADGGALYVAADVVKESNMVIDGVDFTGNKAANGGAIYNAGNVVVANSRFEGNSGEGGAIYNAEGATITVKYSGFYTASDTIVNKGTMKFEGAIALAAQLVTTSKISADGADIYLDIGNYSASLSTPLLNRDDLTGVKQYYISVSGANAAGAGTTYSVMSSASSFTGTYTIVNGNVKTADLTVGGEAVSLGLRNYKLTETTQGTMKVLTLTITENTGYEAANFTQLKADLAAGALTTNKYVRAESESGNLTPGAGRFLDAEGTLFDGNKNGGSPIFKGGFLLSNATVSNGALSGAGAAWNTDDKTNALVAKNVVFLNNITTGSNSGGAVYGAAGTKLVIENAVFQGNEGHWGGAIESAGTLSVKNTIFKDNIARGNGGAIDAVNATIDSSTFTSNTANGNSGLGAYLNGNNTVTNSLFENHVGLAGNASPLSLYGSSATVIGSTFSGNTVTGAQYTWLTAGMDVRATNAYIANNIIKNNVGLIGGTGSYRNDGGIVNISSKNVVLTGNTFSGNTISARGAGLYITGNVANGTFSNNLFENNVSGYLQSWSGGALCYDYAQNFNISILFSGNTFTNNSSVKGGVGGLYINGCSTVTDCVFIGNTGSVGGLEYHQTNGNVGSDIKFTANNLYFEKNYATGDGGGANFYSSPHTEDPVEKFTAIDNYAKASGGGIKLSVRGKRTLNDDGTTYSYGDVIVRDFVLTGNTAGSNGGGGYFSSDASTTTLFTSNLYAANNVANNGGGAYVSSTISLSNATFTGNTANAGGGGAWFTKGGEITGSTFSNNYANTGGHGGGALIEGTINISDSVFTGNTNKSVTSNTGGGGLFTSGVATIDNILVQGNTVVNQGGGYRAGSGAVTLDNSTITGNIALNDAKNGGAGGGMYLAATANFGETGPNFFDGNVAYNGGGMYIDGNNKPIYISNTTFTNNQALGAGGAVYIYGDSVSVTFENVVFNGNSANTSGGAIHKNNGGTVTLTNVSFLTQDDTLWTSSNINVSGRLVFAGKVEAKTITVLEDDTTFVFDISTYQRGSSTPIITSYGAIVGSTPTYELRINKLQKAGDYVLMGSAATYKSTLSVYDTDDTILAKSMAVGDSFVKDVRTYSLSLANGNLTLTVSKIDKTGTFATLASELYGKATCSNYTYDPVADAALGTNGISVAAALPYYEGDDMTADGIGKSRIFKVTAPEFNAANFTLKNGYATDGGAVYNSGTLSFSNVLFEGNTATGKGGAFYNTSTGKATLEDVSFLTDSDTLYNEGNLTLKGDIIFTGRVDTTKTVTATDATIGINISELKAANTISVISDIGKFDGGNWQVIVRGSQTATTYKLADGAASFTGTISITNAAGGISDPITVGGDAVRFGTRDYSVKNNNGTLELTVVKATDLPAGNFIDLKNDLDSGALNHLKYVYEGLPGETYYTVANDMVLDADDTVFDGNNSMKIGFKVNADRLFVMNDAVIQQFNSTGYDGAIVVNGLFEGNNITFKDNLGQHAALLSTGAGATATISNSLIDNNAPTGVCLFNVGNSNSAINFVNSTFTNNATGTNYYLIRSESLYSSVSIKDSYITGTKAGSRLGYIKDGEVTIENSTFSQNMGGGFNFYQDSNLVEMNLVKVDGALFEGNTYNNSGAALYASDAAKNGSAYESHSKISITGSTFSGNTGTSQVVYLKGNLLEMENSTFSNNRGGGLAFTAQNSTNYQEGYVKNSVFSGNTHSGGVSIWNGGGRLTVTDSIFLDNVATSGKGAGIESSVDLTVEHSTFSGNTSTNNSGAAINASTILHVTNSFFNNNVAAGSNGGAICASGNDIEIVGSTFKANTASMNNTGDGGGGVLISSGTSLIQNNLFENNVANGMPGKSPYPYGGGLDVKGSTTVVTGNTFSANTSLGRGGGAFFQGSSATFDNNLFVNNVAGCTANRSEGGGLQSDSNRWIDVTNSTFSGNTAYGNGGGYMTGARGIMKNLTFINNVAGFNYATGDYGGGGLYSFQTNNSTTYYQVLEIENITAIGNTASRKAGGIYISGNSGATATAPVKNLVADSNYAGSWGGGMVLGMLNAEYEGITATNNRVGGGGYIGGVNGGGINFSMGTATMTNLLVKGNTASLDSLATNSNSAGGGGFWHSAGTVAITNATITDNKAIASKELTIPSGNNVGGGGVWIQGGSISFENALISNNFATRNGGGVNMPYGTASFTNATFTNNTATKYGGGIYMASNGTFALNLTNVEFSGNVAGTYGGALYLNSNTTTIENSKFLTKSDSIYTYNGNIILIGENIFAGGITGMNSMSIDCTASDKFIMDFSVYGANTGAAFLTKISVFKNYAADDLYARIGKDQTGILEISNNASTSSWSTTKAENVITLEDTDGKILHTFAADSLNSYVVENGMFYKIERNKATLPGSTSTTEQLQIWVYKMTDEIPADNFYVLNTNLREGKWSNMSYKMNMATDNWSNYKNGLTIDGNVKKDLAASDYPITIDADYNQRILNIYSSAATDLNFKNVSFKNGVMDNGGAIYNDSAKAVTFTGGTFSGNTATKYGGAFYQQRGGMSISFNTVTFDGNVAGTYGGAFYAAYAGSATVNGSTFSNNMAVNDGTVETRGGAVFLHNGNNYENCNFGGKDVYFIANTADLGGAVYVNMYNSSRMGVLTVLGGGLSNNVAKKGGAVYNKGTAIFSTYTAPGLLDPVVAVLTGNTATEDGGALYSSGTNSMSTVAGSTLTNNIAGNMGGAIYNEGTLQIKNAVLEANTAAMGGALYNNRLMNISGSTFKDNVATYGGAIYIVNPGTVSSGVKTTEFIGNKATADGGAIFVGENTSININSGALTNNKATGNGGAIFSTDNSVQINVSSITVSGNEAANGGAIYANKKLILSYVTFDGNKATGKGGAVYANGTASLVANTFTNNTAAKGSAVYVSETGEVVFADNFFDSKQTIAVDGGAVTIRNGNTFAGFEAANANFTFINYEELNLNGVKALGSDPLFDSLTFQGNVAVDFGSVDISGTVDSKTNITIDATTYGELPGSYSFDIAYGVKMDPSKVAITVTVKIDNKPQTFTVEGTWQPDPVEGFLYSKVEIAEGRNLYVMYSGNVDPSGYGALMITSDLFSSYTQLNDELATGETINLSGRYKYKVGGDEAFKNGIVIDSAKEIIGIGNMINGSSHAGAGLVVTENGSLKASNLEFVFTASTANGGAINSANKLILSTVNVLNSEAKANGGAIYTNGAEITGGTFAANKAAGLGGAIYGTGDLIVSGASFTKNTASAAGQGNAIAVEDGSLTLSDNKFAVDQTIAVIDSRLIVNDGNTFGGDIYAADANFVFNNKEEVELSAINLYSDGETEYSQIAESVVFNGTKTVKFANTDLNGVDAATVITINVSALDMTKPYNYEIASGLKLFNTSLVTLSVTDGEDIALAKWTHDDGSSKYVFTAGSYTGYFEVTSEEGYGSLYITTTPSTFTDLNGAIQYVKDPITLATGYRFVTAKKSPDAAFVDGIVISGAKNVKGSDVTIDGTNAARVFNVAADGILALSDVTLANGNSKNAGGAILNAGVLVADEVTFENNASSVAASNALYNSGTATFKDSTFGASQTINNVGGTLILQSGNEFGTGAAITQAGGTLRFENNDELALNNTVTFIGSGNNVYFAGSKTVAFTATKLYSAKATDKINITVDTKESITFEIYDYTVASGIALEFNDFNYTLNLTRGGEETVTLTADDWAKVGTKYVFKAGNYNGYFTYTDSTYGELHLTGSMDDTGVYADSAFLNMTVKNAKVQEGAYTTMDVYQGGAVNKVTIGDGGSLKVHDQGTISGAVVNGGSLVVLGQGSATEKPQASDITQNAGTVMLDTSSDTGTVTYKGGKLEIAKRAHVQTVNLTADASYDKANLVISSEANIDALNITIVTLADETKPAFAANTAFDSKLTTISYTTTAKSFIVPESGSYYLTDKASNIKSLYLNGQYVASVSTDLSDKSSGYSADCAYRLFYDEAKDMIQVTVQAAVVTKGNMVINDKTGSQDFGDKAFDDVKSISVNTSKDGSTTSLTAGDITTTAGDTKVDLKANTELNVFSITKDEADKGSNNVTVGKDSSLVVKGNVDSVGTLSTSEGSSMKIGGDVIGKKDANSKLSIGKGAEESFIKGSVDLNTGKGTNSVAVGTGSTLTVKEDVKNVTSMTLSDGSVDKQGNVTKTVVTIGGGYASTGKANTLKVGKNSTVTIGGKVYGSEKIAIFNSDAVTSADGTALTIGSNSTLTAQGNLDKIASITVTAGSTITMADKSKVQHYTTMDLTGTVRVNDVDYVMHYSIEGTSKNNTINIGNFSNVTTGSIDLMAGKNTISVGKSATFKVLNSTVEDKLFSGDITGITSFTTTAGTDDEIRAEVLVEGQITMAASKDTLTTGKYTDFEVKGAIVALEGGSLTISVGANSIFKAAALSPVNKLTVGNDAIFTVASIAGTEKADSVSFGNNVTASVNGKMDFSQGGTDTVKIGKTSTLNVNGNIDFADDNKCKSTVTIGSGSKLMVGNITGINKITLDAGVAANAKKGIDEDRTMLIVGNVSSVDGFGNADTLSFGKLSTSYMSAISLFDGADTVNLADTAIVSSGDISLGDGKNAIKLGASAKLNALNITGGADADTLTTGKDASLIAKEINLGGGANVVTLGSQSETRILALSGVNKLTITAGTAAKTKKSVVVTPAVFSYAALGNVSGTEMADTMTFNKITDTVLGNLDMGGVAQAKKPATDKDKLSVATDAKLAITGNIANDSTLEINLAKSSVLGLNDGMFTKYQNGELNVTFAKGAETTAKVYNLGDKDLQASEFTGFDKELQDNDYLTTTLTLGDGDRGWLALAQGVDTIFEDAVDTFAIEEVAATQLSKVKIGADDKANVKVYSTSDGETWSETAATFNNNEWTFQNLDAAVIDYRISVELDSAKMTEGGIKIYSVTIA